MKTLICSLLLSSCSFQVSMEPVQLNNRVGYRVKANVALLAKADYKDTEATRAGDSTAGKVVFPFLGQLIQYFGL